MILSENNVKIKVKHIANNHKQNLEKQSPKQTCKYYRYCNEAFDLEHLGPKGLCLDLYFAAYPYFLALLYGAKFSWENDKNTVHAQCPAPSGSVHFEVRRIPLEKEILSEGIKKKVKIIVKITYIEEQVGDYNYSCICSQKVGQEFEFNQGDFLEQMCPAAFYNIYPTIKSMLLNREKRWSKGGKVYMQCPDNNIGIMFEISKEK